MAAVGSRAPSENDPGPRGAGASGAPLLRRHSHGTAGASVIVTLVVVLLCLTMLNKRAPNATGNIATPMFTTTRGWALLVYIPAK